MNILLFSDLHITIDSSAECISILNELLRICSEHNIDKIINLGDTFDRINPSSQELDIFASFVKQFSKPIIVIAANSHESISQRESILNHFGLLNEQVSILKEYTDDNYLYCGHYIIKESLKNYGATISKVDLKSFKYVFLGHQHTFQIIKPNCCHLGSSRYVNFDEHTQKHKVVAVIENYRTNEEKTRFISIKSAIPMKQIEIGENTEKNNSLEPICDINLKESTQYTNLEKSRKIEPQTSSVPLILAQSAIDYLNKLDAQTKVKIKIHDLHSYKRLLSEDARYKQKFVQFIRENTFNLCDSNTLEKANTSKLSLKEALDAYLTTNHIDKEISDILRTQINEKSSNES